MQFYRNAGGPNHFQLAPEFIELMPFTMKQLCDDDLTRVLREGGVPHRGRRRQLGQVPSPAQEASRRLQQPEIFFRKHRGEVPARRASTVDAKYALQEPHLRPGAGR